jgi:3-deoxy-manno-octulosonate cytidylyltransferase (CMP-KDO synthetase)
MKNKSFNTLILIPARYDSKRFPGKPRLQISETRTLIQYVYEIAANYAKTYDKGLIDVAVVTDDDRIDRDIACIGGHSIRVDEHCACGSERILKASEMIPGRWDCIINLQGDEPDISVDILERLVCKFIKTQADVTTIISYTAHHDHSDKNIVKCFVIQDKVINFSRTLSSKYKHIGIAAFKPSVLKEVFGSYQNKWYCPRYKEESIEYLAILKDSFFLEDCTIEELRHCKFYKFNCTIEADMASINTPKDAQQYLKGRRLLKELYNE